jgi:hypothetical protein
VLLALACGKKAPPIPLSKVRERQQEKQQVESQRQAEKNKEGEN